MWFEGFEHIAGVSSGNYDSGPKRLVLHTTEGSSADGALSAYRANNSWPHFTIDPARRRKIQHVDTAVSARALKNAAGGVETNREGAIQVEIVGYAHATQDMPEDQIKWLAETLAPVIFVEGIHLNTVPFYGTDAGWSLARSTAQQRMSFTDWQNFNGICGHQHVPENDHWDPGKFPIDKFIAYLSGEGEEEVAQFLVQPPDGHALAGSWWVSDGMFKAWIPDGDTFALLRFLGAKAAEDGTPYKLTGPQFDLLAPIYINGADGRHVVYASQPAYTGGMATRLDGAEGRISQRVLDSETRQNGAIAQAVVQSEARIAGSLTAEVKKLVDAIAAIEIIDGEGPIEDPNPAPDEVINQIIAILEGMKGQV